MIYQHDQTHRDNQPDGCPHRKNLVSRITHKTYVPSGEVSVKEKQTNEGPFPFALSRLHGWPTAPPPTSPDLRIQ